ncbi:hypothetical protein Tco_1557197, partial [Tanacetum coccineum]
QIELDRTKEKLESCIIKKEKEYVVLWNNWLKAQLGDLKGKSSDTQCASNTLDPLSQKLENENVRIMQISQENGQSRTNTDTGKEREYKSRKNAIKGQQKSTLGQQKSTI